MNSTKQRREKTDYPLMLDPIHIQEILGIGRKQTYDMLNQIEFQIKKNDDPPFHLMRIGKLIKIPRDQFFNWTEGNKTLKQER